MNIVFFGFRHPHIFDFYRMAQAHPQVQILGSVEEHPEDRAKAAELLGIHFDETTYLQYLKDANVDTVAIGCAYGDRGDAVIAALEHGKHVISDKPLCTSPQQLARIQQLVEQTNRKVMCLLDLRYYPAMQAAEALLQSGSMGKIQNVSFTGQHCLNEDSRQRWYFEKGKHGGTINDLAIHGVDLIRHLAGCGIGKIHAARTWNAYAKKHPDFKDSAIFMAELENGAGVLADISYSAVPLIYQSPIYWNFKLWCEKGVVEFCLAKNDVTVYDGQGEQPRIVPGFVKENSILDDMLQEIREDTTVLTHSTLQATYDTMQIQMAAEKGAADNEGN